MKGTDGEMKDSQPLSEKGLTKEGRTGAPPPLHPRVFGWNRHRVIFGSAGSLFLTDATGLLGLNLVSHNKECILSTSKTSFSEGRSSTEPQKIWFGVRVVGPDGLKAAGTYLLLSTFS